MNNNSWTRVLQAVWTALQALWRFVRAFAPPVLALAGVFLVVVWVAIAAYASHVTGASILGFAGVLATLLMVDLLVLAGSALLRQWRWFLTALYTFLGSAFTAIQWDIIRSELWTRGMGPWWGVALLCIAGPFLLYGLGRMMMPHILELPVRFGVGIGVMNAVFLLFVGFSAFQTGGRSFAPDGFANSVAVCPGPTGANEQHLIPVGTVCAVHALSVPAKDMKSFDWDDKNHQHWGRWWDSEACGHLSQADTLAEFKACNEYWIRLEATSAGSGSVASGGRTAPTSASPAALGGTPTSPAALPKGLRPPPAVTWWEWVQGLNLAAVEPWMGFIFAALAFVLVLGYGAFEALRSGHSGKFGVMVVAAPLVAAAAYVVGSLIPPWTP